MIDRSHNVRKLQRAAPDPAHEMSGDSAELKTGWLQGVLGEEYEVYAAAELAAKADILTRVLSAHAGRRSS